MDKIQYTHITQDYYSEAERKNGSLGLCSNMDQRLLQQPPDSTVSKQKRSRSRHPNPHHRFSAPRITPTTPSLETTTPSTTSYTTSQPAPRSATTIRKRFSIAARTSDYYRFLRKCRFCFSVHHATPECTKFESATSRTNRLHMLRIGTHCMKPSHDGDCNIPTCKFCTSKAAHSQLLFILCPLRFPQTIQ